MRKIVVLYSGGRQWGGIETYLANLFRLYDRQQMELVLVSLGEWDLTRAFDHEALSLAVRVLSGKRARLRTIRDLRRVLRDERAGLVVSQGTVANAYARAAALAAGVPSLVVVHSDTTLDYPGAVKRWPFALSDRALRWVTKRYVTVSRCLKDQMVHSGVRPERVSVIYNGVSTTGRTPTSTQSPHRGLCAQAGEGRASGLVLATVGRLHTVKNFDALIKAMQLLPDHMRLSIWGDGPERASLTSLVDELGLGGRVSLRGESETVGQALEGVDVYVQPSKSEGCSFAVAEAMLHGKPIVVTPCGGLPEQVDDEVTGLVAADCSPEALAAAILTFVGDPGLAARLGDAARKAAEEKFSLGRWMEETTAVFCETARQDERTR
jgi:glycosyltransferase involved in cell wall biosynthesis